MEMTKTLPRPMTDTLILEMANLNTKQDMSISWPSLLSLLLYPGVYTEVLTNK